MATTTIPTIDPTAVLDKHMLARLLGLSIRSIERAWQAGKLPAPTYVRPREPRWLGAKVLQHLERRQEKVRR